MNLFQYGHGYPEDSWTAPWETVIAPTEALALARLIPEGFHHELERDPITHDPLTDDRLPGFRFYFIVRNGTDRAEDYLGIRNTGPLKGDPLR